MFDFNAQLELQPFCFVSSFVSRQSLYPISTPQPGSDSEQCFWQLCILIIQVQGPDLYFFSYRLRSSTRTIYRRAYACMKHAPIFAPFQYICLHLSDISLIYSRTYTRGYLGGKSGPCGSADSRGRRASFPRLKPLFSAAQPLALAASQARQARICHLCLFRDWLRPEPGTFRYCLSWTLIIC